MSTSSYEDRISDLPELVINHIMSLMPTKDAVRTSVLSKDWKCKWTSIRDIDIEDGVSYKIINGRRVSRYSGRVSRVETKFSFAEKIFSLSHDIRSFRLRLACDKYQFSRITSWICNVLVRNVENLTLVYYHGSTSNCLPSSLHFTSLRNLELRLRCTLNVPSRVCFRYLKNLILDRVGILNESCSDMLELNFPLLETLELDRCNLLNVKTMEIHAPALTTFRRTFPPCMRVPNDYTIKIFSERLVEFKFSGTAPEKFVLIGQQVVDATLSYSCDPFFRVDGEIGTHAQTLLSAFSNLKKLEISDYLTELIARLGVSLPVLHHLERLVVSSGTANAKGLLEFLHKAPFLKLLEVTMGSVANYDYNAVEHVPLCVKDHLAEIQFDLFHDSRGQLNLLKFLLENGRALNKVHVVCYNGWTQIEKDEIAEKISELSSSSDLDIVVI